MAKVFGQKSKYLIFGDIKEFVVAFLCMVVILVGSLSMLKITKSFGTFGIAILFIFFLFMRKEFDKHDERSHQFYRGRWGEYDVLDELKKLSDEYTIFQDVQFPESKWNIDFVLIGPAGIFTIEVKSHRGGFIDFNGRELTMRGQVFEKNILRQAKSGAFKIHDYILSKTGKDIFVNAVLVFSHHLVKMRFGFRPVDNVFVVQKEFLLPLITQQPPRLDSRTISILEENLKLLVKI
ncbi:MAG: nuclease-related domain-containing protein [Patescibacteria group bacterium]|nr:nuclease-related domain-containing protein [Patescibacteria group bacterium]